MTITIDTEFKNLIPSLTDEEFAGLEASIVADGRARVPLDVWNGTLLDGHNRFTICARHILPFTTQEVGSSDWTRTDALIWIIRNQFNRRNLSNYTKAELALKLEPLIEEKAKANQSAAGIERAREAERNAAGQLYQKSDKASNQSQANVPASSAEPSVSTNLTATASNPLLNTKPVPVRPDAASSKQKPLIEPFHTLKEVGKTAGVSHDTMHKAKIIAAKADEATKAKLRAGTTTINKVHKEIVAAEKKAEHKEAILELAKNVPDVSTRYQLHHGSLLNALQDIEAGSVDFIITDPPYPREFLDTFDMLAKVGAHVLKDDGLLICMSGQTYLPDVMASLCKELTYHWTMAYLTPGGQATQVFPRLVNTFWKPLIVFSKGKYDRKWFGDVTKSDVNNNDKEHHHWGQSISGMRDLVKRFVIPGDVVMDPFLGGGTTAVVALELGASFIGYDVESNAIETTKARISDASIAA